MPDQHLTLDATQIVAYQGEPGAYSHLACKHTFPDWTSVNCATFVDALQMVERGDAYYAMIPVENSTAGRVEEIYRELKRTHLWHLDTTGCVRDHRLDEGGDYPLLPW